jgi:RNA polymerase sigma-70 factor (ECF subfamily)
MEQDHRALVLGASAGDPGAIDALFERHLPGLLAFVRARAGPALLAKEDSLDLVQSTCREVLRDAPAEGYRDEAGFRHWLFLAAERKILDRARYHGRGKREAGSEITPSRAEVELLRRGYGGLETPSVEAMHKEELAALESALQRLGEEHRSVILLARVVGLSHAQIAEQLGKSEVAVRSLLYRATARLAIEMGEPC